MGTIRRSGPLTEDEHRFIRANSTIMPYDEIAQRINRNPKTVIKYIREKLRKEPIGSTQIQETSAAEEALKTGPFWSDLRKQFSNEELKQFIFQWRRIYTQFKEDVLATEEVQILDTIKLDILMNRLLKSQQKTEVEINGIEKEISQEKAKPVDERDIDYISSLTDELGFRRAGQEATSKEYRDLLEKKSKILEQMKATRNARIKYLENTKQTLMNWIKQILTDADLRRKLGIEAEKRKLAMEKAYSDLSQYHIYADGQADIPIFNTETLEKQNANKGETKEGG